MRINLNAPPMEPPVGPPDKGKVTSLHSPEPNEGGSATLGVDQVHFSFDPPRIQSLQAQALAQPDVRQAKVTALQQALAQGEYAVSASQLADAIVAELGGRNQG